MKLISIKQSTAKNKKLMAVFQDPKKTVHFGDSRYEDYTQHHDKERREQYRKRHSKENWSNPATAGSLSRYVLWGDSTSRQANIGAFKRKFNL